MTDRSEELRRLLIRNVDEVALERQQRAPRYDTMSGRVTEGTAARQLGASYDVLAPGMRGCPYHLHHAEEEMFVILEGHGSLRVAGEMLPVRAGDVVVIPAGPEYPHQFINTSDAPLRFLGISTQSQVEICEYPDSGKYGAYSRPFRAMQRVDNGLDYWDGEP